MYFNIPLVVSLGLPDSLSTYLNESAWFEQFSNFQIIIINKRLSPFYSRSNIYSLKVLMIFLTVFNDSFCLCGYWEVNASHVLVKTSIYCPYTISKLKKMPCVNLSVQACWKVQKVIKFDISGPTWFSARPIYI